jgi:hypothetical protein
VQGDETSGGKDKILDMTLEQLVVDRNRTCYAISFSGSIFDALRFTKLLQHVKVWIPDGTRAQTLHIHDMPKKWFDANKRLQILPNYN